MLQVSLCIFNDYLAHNMKLQSNWLDLIKKAWSIRFMLLAFIFTMAEVMLPFFSNEFPPKLFALMSGLSVAGAFISRLVAQKDVT